MNDRVDYKELWNEIVDTEDVQEMWLKSHLKGISGFIQNELFNEFTFSKKLQNEILSQVGMSIFSMYHKKEEINFYVIATKLREIVKQKCEKAKVGKVKLKNIMTTLDQSLSDIDQVYIIDFYIKLIILDTVYGLDLFNGMSELPKPDNLPQKLSDILDQLRD